MSHKEKELEEEEDGEEDEEEYGGGGGGDELAVSHQVGPGEEAKAQEHGKVRHLGTDYLRFVCLFGFLCLFLVFCLFVLFVSLEP